MFRQRFPQCSCQLFSPQTLHPTQYRSPPPHSSRPQMRSKKSLKSQSNSRNKNLVDRNILASKFDQINQKKLLVQQFARYSTRAPSSIADHVKNVARQSMTPITTIKNRRADNLFRISKENQAYDYQLLQDNGRVISPLHLRNDNIVRSSAYASHNAIAKGYNLRPVDSSPTSTHKIHIDNVRSGATTLAGSVAPSIEEGLNPVTLCNYNYRQSQANKQEIQKVHPQIYRQDFNNGGVLSNINHLSRLSEIMNRQECQSIYDGDKSLNEESRVLLSYKKLVEEKQGHLESTDHKRLFDFYREPTENSSKSGVFEKLTLIAPSNR